MRKKWKSRISTAGRLAVRYLDDIMMLVGQGCLTAGAWEAWGRPAGLAVLGAALVADALIVARAKANHMRRGGI